MAQMNSCFAQFFYRVNGDQTVEAICGFCFVASRPALNQAELREWEQEHVCSERRHPSSGSVVTTRSPQAKDRYGWPGSLP